MGPLKRRTLALPLLLVLLMAAPPWLTAAAQAPGLPPLPSAPTQADPLVRLLEDLQGFLGGASEVGEEVAEGDANGALGAALGRANATRGQVEEAAEQLRDGVIRTLFYEGFENAPTLEGLGWSQEVLRGQAPWGIVDQVNNTVVRGNGAVFEPEYEEDFSPVVVKDGRHSATLLNPSGRYDPQTRARLISPVIDLRGVVGASARTDDPYDLLTKDPRVGEPYRTFLSFWRQNLGELNGGIAHSMTFGNAYTWLLTTPPSQLQRLYLTPQHDGVAVRCSVQHDSLDVEFPILLAPCGPVGEEYFVNPLAERYGAGLVNLTFYHKYDLTTSRSSELPGARQDGVFLEARVIAPDGTVGPWELLLGDTVFEPTFNRDTPVPSVLGPPGTQQSLSSAGVWPSGAAEMTQGAFGGGSDYNPVYSRYTGRVQVRPESDCFGSNQTGERPADCQPDAPAFVLGSPGRVKSHFTLNRYAGHQVQLAWRVHSGSTSIPAEASGWFLDAVRVDALLHARDAAVTEVTKPRAQDLVPASVLVQPEAVVQNTGFQAMEGLRVNFTLLEERPALTPEGVAAHASADAKAVAGAVGEADLPATPGPGAPAPPLPGTPAPPGNTVNQVAQQASPPRVLLQTGVVIPRLESLEKRTVQSPLPCTACVPGQYRLKVEVTASGLGGGEPGELPLERVEDGGRANNALETVFEIRDAPAAAVTLTVAAASVLTDLNEPKTLRLQVENTGNTHLAGVVEVTGRPLDPKTLQPVAGQGRFPVGSLFVGPGELPPSRRVTSYGEDDPFVRGNVTWTPTNLPPGVYLLEAQFNSEPATGASTAANAFIRASPHPYFPGDGRDREDFDLRRDRADGFSRELLRYADFVNRGWAQNAELGPAHIHSGPLPLPLGPVSLLRSWTATATDGPLLELSVLSLLQGNPVSVSPGLSPPGALSVPGLDFGGGALEVDFPNVTLDLDRGVLHVPPIVVRLPAMTVKPAGAEPTTVPPQRLETPAQNLPLPRAETPDTTAEAPQVEVQTPPFDLATEPVVVQQGPATVTVPPLEVHIPPMRVRAFPAGVDLSRVAANATPLRVEVGPVTLGLPTGEEVRTPPVQAQSPPLAASTQEAGADAPPLGSQSLDLPDVASPPLPGTGSEATPLPVPDSVLTALQNAVQRANDVAVVVKAEERGVRVCVRPPDGVCDDEGGRFISYSFLQDTLFTANDTRAHPSYLNDYYLTRIVNVTDEDCPAPCEVSFWHNGLFAWQGGTGGTLDLPGALGGPLDVPGGIQTVSPDQAVEDRSRGLLEATVLDSQGATVRHDLLPDKVPSPGQQQDLDGCAITAPTQACATLGTLDCVAPARNSPVPPPDGSGVLPLLGTYFQERLIAGGSVCAAEAAARPVGDAVVLKEWRTQVPHWNHTVIPLDQFRGHRIALSFHFQTTVARQGTNSSTGHMTCSPPMTELYCTGSRVDHWNLDNIRVGGGPADNKSGGFYDPVGDPEENTEWQNWSRSRTLREVADQNVQWSARCYEGGGPVAGLPLLSPECLQASNFTGVVLSVDGRGWNVFDHNVGTGNPPNPFHDLWSLDPTAGFQPPGRPDSTRATALRWGGVGPEGQYRSTESSYYSLASTRIVSLAQAAEPFLEFQANYTFSRADASDSGLLRDGATVFLARYHRDPGCVGTLEECLVLDRRTLLVPEGGYPGRVHGNLNDAPPGGLNISWEALDARGALVPNAFVGRSGTDPVASEFVPVRIELRQALDGLCLKQVDDLVRTFDREQCQGFHTLVEWSNGVGVHKDSGRLYRNVTGFDQDASGRYAVEIHAQNSGAGTAYGLAVDDLRIGERHRANDLGVSRFVVPGPGQVLGPDEAVALRVNVTNFGLFTQRGVRLHYNVTQQGAQVFPDPVNASRNPPGCSLTSCNQVTPLGLAIPGLREDNPQHNVTVAFEVPWTPQGQGLFTLHAWTELLGEVVGGELLPLADENFLNDLFSQDVEVRKVHSVRLLPATEHPDEAAVTPLVGTADDLRTLRVQLQNLGTVSEGDLAFEDLDTNGDGVVDRRVPRTLTVSVEITDETGRRVANQPDPHLIDLVAPGKTLPAEFRWQPPSGGLFTLRFRAHSDLDLSTGDNERVVRVLVLTQLIPAAGQAWNELFQPEGRGWSNLSRALFDQGEGWSFGVGDGYAALQNGSLVLELPSDLTNFRNAVLTLRHAYHFEEGYDGGVVEVSADGTTWEAVAPLRTTDQAGNVLFEGYPGQLTTASPEVRRPGDEVGAFTGDSGGVVTSVMPLGTVDLTRTEPLVLLRDTFDPGAVLAGTDFAELRGQWAEVITNSTPPSGKAWWVNKTLVWSPFLDHWDTPGSVVNSGSVTLEGHKSLYAVPRDPADPLRVRNLPKIDAPLVVEYDEWRALGLGKRGATTIQSGYFVPNAVEVALERLNVTNTSQVLGKVTVLPASADATDPYGDNYLDWTRRTIIVPSTQVRQLLEQPVRLAFRVHLANANNEGGGPYPVTNADNGTGSPEDTDFLSPNLGWAVASPRLYFVTSKKVCDDAGLTFREGRCFVFEDDLEYADSDAARATWIGDYATAKHYADSNPLVVRSGPATSDALIRGGWKLVDAVMLPSTQRVWDTAAAAPERSGHGRIAEASGSGVDTRLITPLNLRSAASDAVLRLNHSFKFSDLHEQLSSPALLLQGGVSGGRVEASRDGGQTWEPLVPLLDMPLLADGTPNLLAYHRAVEALGLHPLFQRGFPAAEQQCARPTHPGCVTPETLFDAPAGWLGDGGDYDFTPLTALSAHTPFGTFARDPERNSPLGLGSRAFSGTTCLYPTDQPGSALHQAERRDPCGGAEDWREIAFDLSPYAGQEILLAFHAFFTTHRDAARAHKGCPLEPLDRCTALNVPANPLFDDEILVPEDFWRLDDLRVESRVLDGKPLYVRLRGFSDANGEGRGWDVLNITLLGDKHLRNAAVRVVDPQPGAPLLSTTPRVDARVVNRGQETLRIRGSVLAEQAGSAPLRNPGFEVAGAGGLPDNWTATAANGVSLSLASDAAEGARAFRANVSQGAGAAPFRLAQEVPVPPGAWRLVGLARVDAGAGAAGVQLLGVNGPDGRANPTAAFVANGTFQTFEVPFLVEGRTATMQLALLASNAVFPGAAFHGTVVVDHLRLEPRAAATFPALANGGFEDGLRHWAVLGGHSARVSGVADRYRLEFPVGEPRFNETRGEAPGSENVTLSLTFPEHNLTEIAFTARVNTATVRPFEERINVTIRGPDGTVRAETTQPLLAGAGVTNPCPTVLNANPCTGLFENERFRGASISLSVDLAEPPEAFVVRATSPDEALRQAPPADTSATGTWTVTVRLDPVAPHAALPEALTQAVPHTHAHEVEVEALASWYVAEPIAVNSVGVGVVGEGLRSALVSGLGRGPGDVRLEQALALPPGKYRFEGLLGTRDAQILLTQDEDGSPAWEVVVADDATVVQNLSAADLPRHITAVRLWSNATATQTSGQVQVQFTDLAGRPLGPPGTADLKPSATEGASTIPVEAVIPAGVDRVLLRITNTGPTALRLQAHQEDLGPEPRDPYANGTLESGGVSLGRDLRVVLVGAHEPATGTATAWLNGGVAASPQPRVHLNQSIEHPLRQMLDLRGLEARRITSVAVNVTLPSRPNVNDHHSLREGWIHAVLLDPAGRPLSDEATYCACTLAINGTAEVFPLPNQTVRAVLEFQRAFLPPGTTEVVLALRVVNFTQADNVTFSATEDLRGTEGVPGNPLENGALLRNGQPLLAWDDWDCDDRFQRNETEVEQEAQRRALLGLPPPTRVTCDLAVDLTWQREGRLTLDAQGATGDALVLVQPTDALSPNLLDSDRSGGLAFGYDFLVPAGSGPTTLRVHADQWQGELVLDALRLVPLSAKAAVFEGSVAGGQEVALANGTTLDAVRGASYVVRAEVVALSAEGEALGELVLGDNVAVVHTGPTLGPGRLVLERIEGAPNSVNLTTGEASLLRLTVRNEGASEAELESVSGQLRGRDGSTLREFTQADFDPVPDTLVFAPQETRVLTWPFLPEATTPHGVYVLEAEVVTQPVGDAFVAPSANSSLLYLGTDFHSQFAFEWPFSNASLQDELSDYIENGENLFNTRRWTSAGEFNRQWPTGTCPTQNPQPPANSDPCQPDADEERPVSTEPNPGFPKNWMWRKTSVLNLSAFRSITLGGDSEFPLGWILGCTQMCLAQGTAFATVRSAAIPITDMQRPQLVYADRHDFSGKEPEGSIYARLLDAGTMEDRSDWVVFPEGPCLDQERRHGWVLVDDHIQGTSPGYRQGKWFARNVDLGPLLDRAAAETGNLSRWDHVQLCWHLEQPSPAEGPSLIKEWSLDDVLVTPYGIGLGPAQRSPITDNVSKDFRLLLKNRGAYTDTYELRLEEESGLPSKGPANWKVELFDEDGRPLREVRVAPGEERVVVARVRVDVAPPTLARTGTVDIALTAISRTTSFLRSTQHLLFDFTYEDRSNLRIAGLIVNDATLSVDKPRTVDVLVQNNGPVTARRATVAVVDRMDASLGVAPQELRQLDGTPVPEFDLAPGDTRVVTVNWIPRLDGEHNLTALADPDQRLLEFDERDNVLVRPILVPKAEFPDLLVEATASQSNPSPGDLVEVSLRITNKGGAAAEGIQVSIRAGVTDLLPGEPPHILPQALLPGQTLTVNATWRPAFPGEQTIIARARTFAGVLERLETSGDNVQLLTIRVRSRGLDLGLPADLVLKPGGLVNATLEVRNRGDVDDTYVLRLEPPDDWRGVFLPEGAEEVRVSVGNHSARNVTVQLGAPRHAEAGPTQVLVHARSENGTEAVQAGLVVGIPQDFGLRFRVEPEQLLLPGVRFLPITLVNGGNGLDNVTVRARVAPEGWAVEPQTFFVNPKATAEVRVKVTSPTTTPEGPYRLVLEAQGRGGDLLAQEVMVQVLPYELLALRLDGIGEVLVPGQAVEGTLVVRNDGNQPARADLRLSVPVHWRLRLERDVVALGPGEARPLTVGLVVPANATSRALPLVALATSGTGAAYDLTRAVRGARADLAVVALEQPRGQVRDGATLTLVATVANQGEAALPAALALYVDDALLGFEEGPLVPPGGEARINLTFKARGGEHVVLVTVDPAQQLGEEDEDDNARLLVLRVDRAAGLFAVPGAEGLGLLAALACAAALLRRRRGLR